MTKKYDIPTNDQLTNIALIINEQLEDIRKENITVVFELSNTNLKQIDEEYFFKNNKDAKISDFEPADEVDINILGLKFKFIEKNSEENFLYEKE